MKGTFFATALVIALAGTVSAETGSVCLGPNLSVAYSEHTERLYLTVGDSAPIYFYKPERPPRIVADGLDVEKRYLVKVYFDGEVVQSWYIDFKKLECSMVYLWRAKGAWRMASGKSGDCVWPPDDRPGGASTENAP